ncbi:hypothetical protein ACJJTC_000831 [Scirpophaga incertulas]
MALLPIFTSATLSSRSSAGMSLKADGSFEAHPRISMHAELCMVSMFLAICAGSHDDADYAAQIAKNILTIHSSACMEMRGWASNDPSELQAELAVIEADASRESRLSSTHRSGRSQRSARTEAWVEDARDQKKSERRSAFFHSARPARTESSKLAGNALLEDEPIKK